MKEGNGWRLKLVKFLDIHTVVFKPLQGSSYIPLPEEICRKKAVINIENDNKCFMWAVKRALNPVKRHASHITKILRLQAKKLNFDDMTFPTTPHDRRVGRFEQQNVAINIFGYEKKAVYPLKISTVKG